MLIDREVIIYNLYFNYLWKFLTSLRLFFVFCKNKWFITVIFIVIRCQSGEELRVVRQVTRPASSYWDVLSSGMSVGAGYASPRDLGLVQRSPIPCSRQPQLQPQPITASASVAVGAQQQTTVKKTLSAPNLLDDATNVTSHSHDQCRNCGKHS